MIVAIGSDHAGFEQKSALAEYIASLGYEVIDEGPFSVERVDYPDYGELVANDVATHRADFGVLVCGTGVGMAIVANKINGVRAANVTRADFAVLAREHNDANVVTVSGRFASLDENKAIVKAFLTTPFGGGRHAQRVEKIEALERK